jgi:thiol-disulfide isomerase/thioredoxin
MAPGLIALCAALICALAGGVLFRQRNGRMRTVRVTPPPLAETAPAETGPSGAGRVTSADLGQPLGERATLVQFSSAFCAPCRATRQILTEVTGLVDGVAHVEIDAESRLDLVRRLGVLKTPTVLVTDSAGLVVRRAAGQPRKPDVLAALDVVISTNPTGNDASDISVRPA